MEYKTKKPKEINGVTHYYYFSDKAHSSNPQITKMYDLSFRVNLVYKPKTIWFWIKKWFGISLLLISFNMIGQNIVDNDPSTVKHVYASWIGSTLIGTSVNHFIDRPTLSTWIGGISMFVIGLGKEYIWDKKMKRGVFSKDDIISDLWGIGLGLVTCRVVIDIRQNKEDDKYRKHLFE